MINCPYLEPKQSFFYSLSYLSILRQESWSYDYSQSYAPPTIGIKWERKLKYFLSGHYIKIETRMILSPKKNWTGYSSVLYYAVSELEWVETDYRFRNGDPPTGVLVSITLNRNFIARATTHKESTLIIGGRPRNAWEIMAGEEGKYAKLWWVRTHFSASRDKTQPDDGQYIWRGTQLDLSTQNILPADIT